MTYYDSWLESLIPEETPNPELIEQAAPSQCGVFNWQVFTSRYEQNAVTDWAWQRCQKGPFITSYAKLLFAIHLAFAGLRLLFVKPSEHWHPLLLASHTAWPLVDSEYLEAAAEIEATWSDHFTPWYVTAVEEDNKAINIYSERSSLDFDF